MMSLRSSGIAADIATRLIVNPVRGLPGMIPGGDDVRYWQWGADAARAVALAAEGDTSPGMAYNVCGDIRPFTGRCDRTPVGSRRRTHARAGLIGFEYPVLSDRIEADLGFAPKFKVEDQLAALIAQARDEHGAPT
jgi:nucleoside-diphosphate-sugar epimerase